MRVDGLDINCEPSFWYNVTHSQKVNVGLVALSVLLAGGAISCHFLHLNQSLIRLMGVASFSVGVLGLGNAARLNYKAVNLTPELKVGPCTFSADLDNLLKNYPWINRVRVDFTGTPMVILDQIEENFKTTIGKKGFKLVEGNTKAYEHFYLRS